MYPLFTISTVNSFEFDEFKHAQSLKSLSEVMNNEIYGGTPLNSHSKVYGKSFTHLVVETGTSTEVR